MKKMILRELVVRAWEYIVEPLLKREPEKHVPQGFPASVQLEELADYTRKMSAQALAHGHIKQQSPKEIAGSLHEVYKHTQGAASSLFFEKRQRNLHYARIAAGISGVVLGLWLVNALREGKIDLLTATTFIPVAFSAPHYVFSTLVKKNVEREESYTRRERNKIYAAARGVLDETQGRLR